MSKQGECPDCGGTGVSFSAPYIREDCERCTKGKGNPMTDLKLPLRVVDKYQDWPEIHDADNSNLCTGDPESLKAIAAAVNAYADQSTRIAELKRELAAVKERLREANEPFTDADKRLIVELWPAGYYVWRLASGGIETGPYKTWREAYRAGEGYLQWLSVCESREAIATQLAARDAKIAAMAGALKEVAEKHSKRCQQECTRDVIFLFQRKQLNLHGLPDGLDCQESYITIENEEEFADAVVTECLDEAALEKMRGDGLPLREFAKLGLEYGDWNHQCVAETWITESVWLDRDEAERYGKAKHYNYVDGWRVYGVCANGELADILNVKITTALAAAEGNG
jgi:hypothetical protein